MRKTAVVLVVFAWVPFCGWSDMVALETGAVWKDVKITQFRLSSEGKAEFYIEPTAASTPSGVAAGWYSGVRRADFDRAIHESPLQESRRSASPYPPIEGTVLSVVQADLLRLDTGQKVRLLGADTPETTDPNRPLEYFGRESFLYTKRKAEGQRVRIEFDQRRMDDFGQLLGYVYLADGTFLNLDIVRTGHGHAWFGEPVSDEYALRFREAETTARQTQQGLWSAQQREATSRQWQIAEPVAPSALSAPKNGLSRSSSDYSRPSRSGRRSITVDVEYSERPAFGWGFGGFPMPGKVTELTVQPH